MTAPLLIALIGVFVTVAIVIGGATSWLLARNTPQQRRFRAVVRGGADSTGILVQTAPVLTQGPDPTLKRLSNYLPKSAAETPKIAPPSNCARTMSGLTAMPVSTAQTTRLTRTLPSLATSTSATMAT